MKINDIINEGSPSVVKASEPKPRKVKPSRGGESEHPYQGRLVGSKENTGKPIKESNITQIRNALEDEFNKSKGNKLFIDFRHSFRVWTRGDGVKYKDWDHAEGHSSKIGHDFEDFIKGKGFKYIGTIKGEFGSSPQYDAYAKGGIIIKFSENRTYIGIATKSRLRNTDVWKFTPAAKVEEAEGDIRRGLAALAFAGTLWGAGELTSAKQTPLGQALQQAAAQGDERAAEHLKNLDTYVEANSSVLDQLADEYLRNMGEDRSPGKIDAEEDPCWKGYHMVGTKMKDGREVPNCVPGKKGS